jgi:NTP pyrophosphatase (non-canonical NTP hydrolase)
MMELDEYQRLAKKTAKGDFESSEEEIFCWGLGLTGEAGDVASCIKKTFAHKKDVKNGIRENIGDMMWYAAMICNFFGWDFSKVLDENVVKLKERYGDIGFNYGSVDREMIKWSESDNG